MLRNQSRATPLCVIIRIGSEFMDFPEQTLCIISNCQRKHINPLVTHRPRGFMNTFLHLLGLSNSTISLSHIRALPNQSQLLLAYLLLQGNSEVSLMKGDTDADDMISKGWLCRIPNVTIGVHSFKFQPDDWGRLKSLQAEFLAKIKATDIQFYARTKSSGYPWIW